MIKKNSSNTLTRSICSSTDETAIWHLTRMKTYSLYYRDDITIKRWTWAKKFLEAVVSYLRTNKRMKFEWSDKRKMLKVTQLCAVIVLTQFCHLSSCLFESCDERYQLDSDESITVDSVTTLNARNVSSCRMSVVAPANYIVKVKCTLQFDQLNFTFCPTKRFFISVDGIMVRNDGREFESFF